MRAAVLHLARRGYEAHQNSELDFDLPLWGIIMLVVTIVFFVFANFQIEYVFARLVPTLVMVESTQPVVGDISVSKPLLDEKAPLDEDGKITQAMVTKEFEVLTVNQKPITSSLCRTMRHLRAQGGCSARYRGIGIFALYGVAHSSLMAVTHKSLHLPHHLSAVITAVVCANLATAWTHAAISMPSDKPWYCRVPGWTGFKKIAGPTVFLCLAKEATYMVAKYLAIHFEFKDLNHTKLNAMSDHDFRGLVYNGLLTAAAVLLMGIVFVLPAKVILTRVQASLLSEEEGTIVPFDRTFGGRVVDKALGGTGLVRARDAWQSFSQESRMNLMKVYGKVIIMELVLGMSLAATLIAELTLIMGDDIYSLIPKADQNRL